MAAYVAEDNISYYDYLRSSSLSDDLEARMEDASASIVTSKEDLRRRLEAMAARLSDTTTKSTELNAGFHWGFSELLMSLGAVPEPIEDRGRTWAYMQFESARYAFQRGFYEEALKYVGLAINGFASELGYELEYRFHYLLGTLRLGSFRNNSKLVVDLPSAEQAFLSAARYSRHDLPHEAGRALLAAGWAAYCQGKMELALRYTSESLALHPELSEAQFQGAKILMHMGSALEACAPLKRAVIVDREYCLRILGDKDFQLHGEESESFLLSLREGAFGDAQAARELVQSLSWTRGLRVGKFSIKGKDEEKGLYGALDKASVDMQAARNEHSYFGYLDARRALDSTILVVARVVRGFVASSIMEIQTTIPPLREQKEKIRKEVVGCGLFVLAFGADAVFIDFVVLSAESANKDVSLVGVLSMFIVCVVTLTLAVLGSRTKKKAKIGKLSFELQSLEKTSAELANISALLSEVLSQNAAISGGSITAEDSVAQPWFLRS